jgi:hypothetical protein
MAAIVITVPSSGAGTNPTNTFLPFNRAGTFLDSPLSSPTVEELYMFDASQSIIQGLSIDNRPVSQNYQFGDIDFQNNGTVLVIDPIAGTIGFGGSGILSATAGANSANHLVIYVNGVEYKIQLKNP